MKEAPRVAVLKADGTNNDELTQHAFELAGGRAEIVLMNDLRTKSKKISDFQIIALPGGFSYGDDIISGRVWANEILTQMRDDMYDHVERKKGLVIGICNGFQTLVRTGLLPRRQMINNLSDMEVTLDLNDRAVFDCRPVLLEVQDSKCEFLSGMDPVVYAQTAHGEGKFHAGTNGEKVIAQLEEDKLVAFRYYGGTNPNGSINDIAGITDPSGRILGLMPHLERFVRIEQHPNWRRGGVARPQGLDLFIGMIDFAKQS